MFNKHVFTDPPSTLPLRLIMKDQKNTQIPHSSRTPYPSPLSFISLFLMFLKNQKSKLRSHPWHIHVFKHLKQVVRFGLPYKEKRKRKLCARATSMHPSKQALYCQIQVFQIRA